MLCSCSCYVYNKYTTDILFCILTSFLHCFFTLFYFIFAEIGYMSASINDASVCSRINDRQKLLCHTVVEAKTAIFACH